jgi:hypothetical protein
VYQLAGECVSKIDRKRLQRNLEEEEGACSHADAVPSQPLPEDLPNRSADDSDAGAFFQLADPARQAVASFRNRRSSAAKQSASYKKFAQRFQQNLQTSSPTIADKR